MIVAIASGKGGTGKTTLAVNLAAVIGKGVRLLDCDVEEPNAHIFLRPEITGREPACIPVPAVDHTLCTACGKCAEACQFKAIAAMKSKPLIFEELCHGCGGCIRACPSRAISEKLRPIGVVEMGEVRGIQWVQGKLNVGEAMAPPLIREVKKHAGGEGLTLIDCPPGTSCPVIAAMRGADRAILVTEPTLFGLHDLTLAVETVRQTGLPFGVVINRADVGDGRVVDYCEAEGIEILAQIPESRDFAEAYAHGNLICEVSPDFRAIMQALADRLDAGRGVA